MGAQWRRRAGRDRAPSCLPDRSCAACPKGCGQQEGAAPQVKAVPRVVLDTNVVLSALLFGAGVAGRVRVGWQSGRFVPLASAATARELVRVLAYPKFRLTAAEQEDLL